MTDETVDMTDDGAEYTLDDLSKLANVTPRTVRYYIVEGLLPPPVNSGRNATYSQEHLDRLLAISSLKEMYLPLREIRHRLNTLTPEQMRDPAYLATLSQAVSMERAMKRGRHHGPPRGRQDFAESSAEEYLDSIDRPRAEMRRGPWGGRGGPEAPLETLRDARSMARGPIREAKSVSQPASQTWERFPLGEDAELMIRSSKVQNMGPKLYRTLHRLRHMIEADDNENERNRS